jgi:GNAT superfamily N-acetyltransferase
VWWRKLLLEGWSKVLVDSIGGEVTGFASFAISKQEERTGWCEINALYILPSFWRRGIGRKLLKEAELTSIGAPGVTLWVFWGNKVGRQFYASCGYSEDGQKDVAIGGATFVEIRATKRHETHL